MGNAGCSTINFFFPILIRDDVNCGMETKQLTANFNDSIYVFL